MRAQNLKLSWYTRGGATYEDVMNMSFRERQLISDMAKENMETANKTRLPFF